MGAVAANRKVLVMGVGNSLLQDDGVGIHVTERLRHDLAGRDDIELIDGGTIGLALLPAIENADALIIVDAAEMHIPPGGVRVFLDGEIDRQLSGRRSSVHELAISDLLSAAALRGHSPRHRALVAIQPESTAWGLEPTPAVRAAIPAACAAVTDIAARYQQ